MGSAATAGTRGGNDEMGKRHMPALGDDWWQCTYCHRIFHSKVRFEDKKYSNTCYRCVPQDFWSEEEPRTDRKAVVKVLARMESGEIVEFAKDCECANHDGPHWLAMHEQARQKMLAEVEELRHNAGSINPMLGMAYLIHLSKQDDERLAALIREYERRGIAEIIREKVQP